MSEEENKAKSFVVLVRRDLPFFAERTDALMRHRGTEDEDFEDMPHIWLEAGADITNQDIASGNEGEEKKK